MNSSGSRALFSVVYLAILLFVSKLILSILSKKFASVLITFSYELPRSDSTGRRGVLALSTLAKPYKRPEYLPPLTLS